MSASRRVNACSARAGGERGEALALALELRARDDGLRVERAIDGQHAGEVIELVLEELGLGRLQVAPALRVSALVLELERDRARALDAHQQLREAEAVVPQPEALLAALHDARVD